MQHRNNFDFLRLFAAALVVVGHGYALVGHAPPKIFSISVSTFGVITFFSISGYLIAGSWERQPRLFDFFLKRILRLFPALIVIVLLTAFLFGPIVSDLNAKTYFSDPATYGYLKNSLLYIVYYLPGVFITNPLPNAVNGSLWSLPVEFFCYMMLPMIGMFASRFRLPFFVFLSGGFSILATYLTVFKSGQQFVFYATDLTSGSSMAAYFAAGAAIWHLRRLIPAKITNCVIAGTAYFILSTLEVKAAQFFINAISTFLLSYIIITIGEIKYFRLPNAARWGDFSYGLYLYAFPIQQLLIKNFRAEFSEETLIALALIISMPCAILSWHLVEKYALRLKPDAAKRPADTSEIKLAHS
jgi:peptidoglycan/LPS O-acetylase OafA/YrhL